MTNQSNDAAERSAHVTRGGAKQEVISPVVEIAPGLFRLRVLVEAEAEIARLTEALQGIAGMSMSMCLDYRDMAQRMMGKAQEALRM